MELVPDLEPEPGRDLDPDAAGDVEPGGAVGVEPGVVASDGVVAELWGTAGFEAQRAHWRVLDERIGVLSGQIHALEAELVDAVAEFDAAGGWQGWGLRSLGQWLSVRAKFTSADANRVARVAQRMGRVSTLMVAAREGRMSLGVLDAAARVSTPENEAKVARVALACTPAQLSKVLASYRDLRPEPEPEPEPDAEVGDSGASQPEPDPVAETGPEPEPDPELECWWRSWVDDRGRGRVDAALDPTAFALLEKAWQAATRVWERDRERAGHGDVASPGGGRTDVNAIAEVLATNTLSAVNGARVRDRGDEKFLVQLHLDVETMARILGLEFDHTLPFRLGSECFLPDTGQHLSDAEAARFLCEGKVQVLLTRNGVPLWLGNEERLFTRGQRRAMRYRAGGRGGCEFPGCTHDRYLDGHHVRFHADGEPTALDNGVFLCGFHHRLLHKERWRVVVNGDQTYTFWNGHRCLGTTAKRAGPGGRPPDLMRLPGLEAPDPPDSIDGDTPKSGTRGERMTRYALDVFLEILLTA